MQTESAGYSFGELLLSLLKWKKFIFLNVLTVAVITAIVSLLLPKWWTSQTTLILETPGLVMNLGSVAGVDLSSFGLGGGSVEYQRNLAILGSRRLAMTVIKEFDLQSEYQTENMEATLESFYEHLEVDFDDELEVLNVSFETKDDSIRCVEILKFLVFTLDRINKELSVQSARNQRVFLERKYKRTIFEVDSLATIMKQYQTQHDVISFEEQVTASVELIAEIQKEILKTEIQLNLAESAVGINHPDYLILQSSLYEIKNQLKRVMKKEKGIEIALRYEDIVEVGYRLKWLETELLIKEKILEFLLPQYEASKLEESRNTPTLSVLDHPVTPELRSRPRRTLMVLAFSGLAFLLSTGFVGFIEYVRKNRDNPTVAALTSELGFLLPRRFKSARRQNDTE